MAYRLGKKVLVLLFVVATALCGSGWFGTAEAADCFACLQMWSNCDDNCNHCFYDFPDGDPRIDICFTACEDRCFNRYNNCLDTCTI